MKYIILFLLVWSISCGRSVKNRSHSIEVESDEPLPEVHDSLPDTTRNAIIRNPSFKVDTLFGKYRLSLAVSDNDDTVSTDRYRYMDRSVFLTLSRNQERLLERFEINKHNFDSIIPHDVLPKVQLWNCFLEEIDDGAITFMINICVPDTDDCYPILLKVDSLGRCKAEELQFSS